MTSVEKVEQKKDLSAWASFRQMTREVHRGFVAEWTVTIILLLFATTTLVQAFVIPSSSMESTLLVGDHLLVDKLAFAPAGWAEGLLPYREVRRGDIIVFRYPLDINQDYVKRAIGIPGDRIRFEEQQLILNGKRVREPYVQHAAGRPDPYRDNFPGFASPQYLRPSAAEMIQNHVVNGELVVPSGFIFAMGDNRDNSDDSRYWGLVPRVNVRGTPLIIYWSYDATTEALTNGNIGFDHLVDVVTHFFTKTRWERTFKLTRGFRLE